MKFKRQVERVGWVRNVMDKTTKKPTETDSNGRLLSLNNVSDFASSRTSIPFSSPRAMQGPPTHIHRQASSQPPKARREPRHLPRITARAQTQHAALVADEAPANSSVHDSIRRQGHAAPPPVELTHCRRNNSRIRIRCVSVASTGEPLVPFLRRSARVRASSEFRPRARAPVVVVAKSKVKN